MVSNRQLFLAHVAQTSTAPMLLEVERAQGVYLYEKGGRKIIDLIAGISVCNIGHAHPAVVAAVSRQAAEYMHLMVYGEVVQSPQVEYAALLVQHLPPSLNSVYFTNSGAEATEGAMKLAKRLTGRTQFVSFKNAYHGSTQGALSLMGDEYFKQSFRPLLPDTLQLRYGNIEDLEQITGRTAAVFIETIQAESGVTVPDLEFMQQLRRVCDMTGTLLVLDEIQAGMGRTGKLWAFEHYHIVPDILLLAKALGGGMPLGAFIADRESMMALAENPVLGHITTFGGHPVCCAAGKAAFEVLLQENLIEYVEAKGALFELFLSHPAIKSIRRKGLIMAVEFESFEQNKKIIDKCLELGVFTDWFLFGSNYLRIAPPLTINEQEIEAACAVICKAIDEVI
jgi:acetylornithine/N-succinyldiaminopimelate aminotransferase